MMKERLRRWNAQGGWDWWYSTQNDEHGMPDAAEPNDHIGADRQTSNG